MPLVRELVKKYRFELPDGNMSSEIFGRITIILAAERGYKFGINGKKCIGHYLEGITLNDSDIEYLEKSLGYPVIVTEFYEKPDPAAAERSRGCP